MKRDREKMEKGGVRSNKKRIREETKKLVVNEQISHLNIGKETHTGSEYSE